MLTGIRSNSELTLGNYLGAIAPTIKMATAKADQFQINMFVPDLHSFTTPIDHKSLYKQTLQNIYTFVAAGLPIDHPNIFVYRQSFIPAHSELAWILSCFVGVGEAGRMVEFKEKSQALGADRVSVGLFNYPILMAADILLYDAKYIPVGDDQRQHLELARDIALRMNNKFGQLFVVPLDLKKQQAFIDRDAAPRIRSLRNPDKKMSKSVDDPAGTILLTDKPKEAAQKVMSATTDSFASINFDFVRQPGVSNLLQIAALLGDEPVEQVAQKWHGQTKYGLLKSQVADRVEKFLSNHQQRRAQTDTDSIIHKLKEDEETMRQVANETLQRVQKAVGLRA